MREKLSTILAEFWHVGSDIVWTFLRLLVLWLVLRSWYGVSVWISCKILWTRKAQLSSSAARQRHRLLQLPRFNI